MQDQDDEYYFAAGNNTTNNYCIHAGGKFTDTFNDHFISNIRTMSFNLTEQFFQEFYFNKALICKVFVDTVILLEAFFIETEVAGCFVPKCIILNPVSIIPQIICM